jgi:hypothetical protein
VSTFGDTRGGKRQIMTLNETHIFSQALVNEARAGFNRRDGRLGVVAAGAVRGEVLVLRQRRRDGGNGINTEKGSNGGRTEKTNICSFPFVLRFPVAPC